MRPRPTNHATIYEDNEHDVAARAFFEKHGYRPLTRSQSNAVALIGIVCPHRR